MNAKAPSSVFSFAAAGMVTPVAVGVAEPGADKELVVDVLEVTDEVVDVDVPPPKPPPDEHPATVTPPRTSTAENHKNLFAKLALAE